MDKNRVRLDALNFLGKFDDKIKTKFSNICAKTGQYDVPSELFQKRTPRKNRVLLSWKDVKNNGLSMLLYCKGGADMARKVNKIKKSGFAPIGVEPLFAYGEVLK